MSRNVILFPFSLLKSPNTFWRILESSGVFLLLPYVSPLCEVINDIFFLVSPKVSILPVARVFDYSRGVRLDVKVNPKIKQTESNVVSEGSGLAY